jgi:hypothetical protein
MEPQRRTNDLVLVPGPLESAWCWITAVIQGGSLAEAWPATDPNLRLALAQSWIWNNRSRPPVSGWPREELARGLSAARSSHPLWQAFADRQVEKLRSWWGNPNLDDWGATVKGSVLPSAYELIRFAPIRTQAGRVPKPPTKADGRLVLMCSTGEQWLLAAFDRTPPIPGWPPRG